MLTMKRREMLVCGAATAALPLSSASFAHAAGRENLVVVYSRHLPKAQRLANKTARSGSNAIPLKGDIVQLWRRQISKHRGAVKGYTNWADYVLLRGLAEEQGLRLRAEQQVSTAPGKPMFIWTMA